MDDKNLIKLKIFLKHLKRSYGINIDELYYTCGTWIFKDTNGNVYEYDEETEEIKIIKEAK